MTATLESALDLAARGFYVFPVKRGKKTPLHEGWQAEATRDPETIRKLWGTTPANIGIFTGRYRDGRALVVVDVDVAKGKRGEETLLGLELQGYEFPRTLEHETPSGGRHLFFAVDAPLRQGTNTLGPGIDVRSAGGYLVGPGSVIDGKAYRQVNGFQVVAEAPAWLVERLGRAPAPTTTPKEPPPNVDPARARERAIEYLKTARPAVEGQGGDALTYQTAARLKDLGVSGNDAVFLMDEHWNDRCSPPWTLDELATKVGNAYRYGSEVPGSAAPEAVFDVVPEEAANESTQEKKRNALDVIRWGRLKDIAPPPVRYIWDPFFPAVPFGILASHPGHGKSMLCLQLAVSIATGLPLFGIQTGGPGGVGVLSLEDDETMVHRRLMAIRRSYGFDWTPAHDDLLDRNFRLLVRSKAPADGLNGAAAAHRLAKLAKELGTAMKDTQHHPVALFLDTLNAIHEGDENSNTEVRALNACVFGLHDALNCSVWVTHHIRKSGTGRSAPVFHDRLDPELVRGAGALVGSARAVVQFGWVTPSDATKAGLEIENCHRRYAVLANTKNNSGPLSPWLLLEHSSQTGQEGIWVPVENGEEALAKMRSAREAQKLKLAEAILLDFSDGLSREEVEAKHFSDDPKAKVHMKTTLQDMRRKNRGWLEPAGVKLTPAGLKKALELRGRNKESDSYPDDPES